MTKSFKAGDEVEWHSRGTVVVGKVIRKVTEDMKLAGHQVRASGVQSSRHPIVRGWLGIGVGCSLCLGGSRTGQMVVPF